jgi:catechol 2,3-dioxygenase-like lactoylglutathione lyase family enzyme
MRSIAAIGLSAVLLSSALVAQGPAPAPVAGAAAKSDAVVGFMHAIHATNSVEKTLAFYTEVFGIKGNIAPFANTAVPILTNSPGVTLRVTMLRLPGEGFNFELTEFSNTERHPAQPDIADPGAPHMKLLVRDLGAVVAAARRVGAPMITRNGQPVRPNTLRGPMTGIFFRDPDGYIVQAIQAPSVAADAPAGNVLGAMMGETVGDMDTSMKFWRGTLGLDPIGETKWSNDKADLDLLGLPAGAEVRTLRGVIPGSTARIEFMEIKGVPRKPFDLRVPDPGASGMALRVAEIQKLLPRLKSQGVRVLSRNGDLVEWSPTVRNVFVKDPDGLNLELVGDAPAQSSK